MFQPRPHRLMHAAREMTKAVGQPLHLPQESAKVLLPEPRVEPGDVLMIEPAQFDAPVRLPSDLSVQADGALGLGRFGRLPVSGKTVEQIRTDVEHRLLEHTKKEIPVNVSVIERHAAVYYVLGAVNSPGAYPLRGHETALDAIIEAGGITDQADQSRIILSRPSHPDHCRVVLPVCYPQIVQLGDTSTNYQLTAGDRVYVPSTGFWRGMFRAISRADEPCPNCALPQVPCGPGLPALPMIESLESSKAMAPAPGGEEVQPRKLPE